VILADTSVWVDHLRRGNRALVAALEAQEVVTHPFVIGELACGDLRDRRTVLDLLHRLPTATVATDDEALSVIERSRLMGRGLGYIDVHLLAAALLSSHVTLWTFDTPLAAAAARLGVARAR
jgi:predicted nucleic acid-binding protein